MLRRGFALSATDRVLIVEDVITTGGSTREAADVATDAGAHVVGAAAIVDRSRDLTASEPAAVRARQDGSGGLPAGVLSVVRKRRPRLETGLPELTR